MPDTAPLVHTIRVQVDPVATGATAASEIGEAPFAGTVTRVAYIPAAAISGANTNSRTDTVTNRGAAGAGSTIVATIAFVAGVNGVANDAKEATLSATPANLVVAAGDVLTFDSAAVGTGLADPGGSALVEITRS